MELGSTGGVDVELLLVDDRPANLLSLRALLEQPGRKILTATSGEEALRLLLRHDVAVVLLDVSMPGMDGHEVARLMRAQASTREGPVIFVTALERTAADLKDGYEAGAVDYLQKPLDPAQVRAKVEVFERLWLQQRVERARSENLERLTGKLERRVEHSERELDMAHEGLEAIVYAAFHNLRSSARSVEGLAAVLTDELEDRLDPSVSDLLSRIGAAAVRMAGTLEAVARLSMVRLAEIERSHFDLGALAADIVTTRWPARAAQLHVPRSLPVHADYGQCRTLLEVLLDNAFKYTRPIPEPRIELLREGETEPAVFLLRDNGVGFDPRFADRVFAPFYRLHGPGEFEGEGIGLTLARQVTTMHGGRVWAEGTLDEGARLYFTLDE